MAEPPDVPSERPGLANLVWIALPCTVFLVRSILWWRDWSLGTVSPASMTGGQWFRIVFSHAAAIGGVIALVMVLRQRSKVPQPPTMT